MEGKDRLGKQEDSEGRDRLGQEIYQILRETGLVEKTFSAKGIEFCWWMQLQSTSKPGAKTTQQTWMILLTGFPSAPTDHKLAWLPEDKSDPQYVR